MTYQYRKIIPSVKQKIYFDQVDLYFYKCKSTGVGIKARFNFSEDKPSTWMIYQIELKFIKNYQQIKKGITAIEKWKKITTPIELKLLSMKALIGEAKLNETQKQLKQNYLKQICMRIIGCLKKNQQLKQKHFKQNQDLARWMSNDENLIDVIAIKKSRVKCWKREQGVIQAYSLYGQLPNEAQIYQTFCLQNDKQEKLKKHLGEWGVVISTNISYPTFLEYKYQGLL